MSIALMTLACPLCESMGPAEWVEKFGVCDPCAERIANAFSYQRSGQWLTHPNEPTYTRRKEVIGQKLRTKVFERDGYRCLHCGTHLNLTADHIQPESMGGDAVFENLQTLCRSCNSKKGTSL